ncbi:hypothetical protein PFISCL1PPCAC_17336, partial [Pristionchus fissidentatus]
SQMASGSAAMAVTDGKEQRESSAEPTRSVSYMEDRHSRFGSEFRDDDVEARMPLDRNSHKSSVRENVPDTILRLNIGGSSYRIRTRSISRFGPKTLLGKFARMNHDHRKQWADSYFEESDEYFFERVPRYFDPIYDFYATGKLHVPKDLCFDKFMAELRFWAVSKSRMDECCSPFTQYCVTANNANQDNFFGGSDPEKVTLMLLSLSFYLFLQEKDHFIGVRCAKLRRRLWLVLEGHSTSNWWKMFEVTSTSFVVLSIAALILGSIPEFQVEQSSLDGSPVYATATYPTYPNGAGGRIEESKVVKKGQEDG